MGTYSTHTSFPMGDRDQQALNHGAGVYGLSSKWQKDIVYYHIAANGWIITGAAIIQLYMIHET